MDIKPVKAFDRRIICKPDKSVTHRAVMFNAAFADRAEIRNPLISADCLSTMDCMRRLGAEIEVGKSIRIVKGGITEKSAMLDAGNSGTTMRLLGGLLAPVEGRFTIKGDESLSLRPMNRVIAPLSLMGAKISGSNGCAPLSITGAKLRGIDYDMPVNSAQVKSAVLLAGLMASGKTTVREKVVSRDHTERMLASMGAPAEEPAPAPVMPPAPKAPEKPIEEDVTYINVMQTLVEEKALRYIKMFGLCDCKRCQADVKALTLSNLVPKYVVLSSTDRIPMLTVYEGRFNSTIFAQLTRACKTVMDHPHHDRKE